jgi:hypothetical protein
MATVKINAVANRIMQSVGNPVRGWRGISYTQYNPLFDFRLREEISVAGGWAKHPPFRAIYTGR